MSWFGDGSWWRSPSQFDGAESFEKDHRATAVRASPQRPWRETSSCRPDFWRNRAGFGEQANAKREQGAAAAVSQKAEVADADESRRQHVQQELAQELLGRKRHQTLLVLVSGVAPAEGDHAIGECHEPMVGDGHTMRVASTCPPSVAVRQRRIAFSTWRDSQVSPFGLLAKKLPPAARTISATSTGGRGI